MKEFVLDIEYKYPHVGSEGVDAQWDAVMHDIGDYGWVTEDCSEPFQNDDGDMTVSAILTKQCTDDDSTAFTLLHDICPYIRIVGGGLTTSTKEGGN